MLEVRWKYLMAEKGRELNADEIQEGWHFCPEWDFLLIAPGMVEAEACVCGK